MNLSKNTRPLVSVCIPTYNREKTVVAALSCALKQTYTNLEILISDDQSSDNSVKILKKFTDPRIRLVIQKKNLGMIPNWNYCIQQAKGEYIKFLHSDDLIDTTCVEKELALFQKNHQVSLVTCQRSFIDERNRLINTLQFSDLDTVESGVHYAHKLITTLRENRIGEPSAVMFRQKDALKAGLFDPGYSQLADFEFWIRLLQFGDIGYINKPLCSFRVHQGSNTTAAIKDGRFIDETYSFIKKYFHNKKYRKIFHLSDDDQKNVLQIRTKDFLKNIKILILSGDFHSSKVYFKKLLHYVSLVSLINFSIQILTKK